MTKKQALQLFEQKKVRTVLDEEQEKWYFAIVDVVAVLTEQDDYQVSRNYWKVLKNRLKNEGNETVTNCNQFKLQAADGKMRLTDVADTEQLFRLIQSIPSPKAEPFKIWISQVASMRIDQMQELSSTKYLKICINLLQFICWNTKLQPLRYLRLCERQYASTGSATEKFKV